jgi:hypothetical protein
MILKIEEPRTRAQATHMLICLQPVMQQYLPRRRYIWYHGSIYSLHTFLSRLYLKEINRSKLK